MALPTSPVAPIASGITPGGGLGAQLSALTRRAFIPSLYVQVYQTHPLLSLLLSNAQSASGGVGQITVPVQGASFTNFSWGSFGGDFAMPTDQNAATVAQFNLKVGMVPIGFFGFEALVQSSEVVIPKLKAVMSDAAVVIKQAYAQALYSNNYANTQAWDSLAQAYDNGTNVPVYGGIARTGNQYWWGQYLSNQGGKPTTRQGMMQLLLQVQQGAGGEAPDFAVMNPANYAALVADFQNFEMYTTTPRSIYGKEDVVNSGFRAIRIGDTPIFPDPFCPLGTMYLINTRYLSMYMSEQAPMTFSGFYSQIPLGQISQIGVLISAADLVCAKPSSGAQVTGITSAAWANTPGSFPAVL